MSVIYDLVIAILLVKPQGSVEHSIAKKTGVVYVSHFCFSVLVGIRS